MTKRDLQRLMLQFVNEMISNGPDSPALDVMLRENQGSGEFVRLAILARHLRRSARLLPPQDFHDLVDPLE